MNLRVLGLALYGPQAASHRVRLAQFQSALSEHGIFLQVQSLLDNNYLNRTFAGRLPSPVALIDSVRERLRFLLWNQDFDLAIVYAELFPFFPAWIEQKILKIPYIYDFDDSFHLKYRNGRFAGLEAFLGGKVDRLIAGAAAVTAGNRHLAEFARCFNASVSILPSVVDTNCYIPSTDLSVVSDSSPFTVGWIGSPSTAPYLNLLIEPLQRLALERSVRLIVVGGPAPFIDGVEVVERRWRLEHEVSEIQKFHVGVMPLPDTPWTRGKCAYKLIQCMSCAIPVVASAVGTNLQAVPSSCGLLVDSSEQWLSALRQLAADPSLRQRMGAAGRYWVQERYSLNSAIPVIHRVIHDVARQYCDASSHNDYRKKISRSRIGHS